MKKCHLFQEFYSKTKSKYTSINPDHDFLPTPSPEEMKIHPKQPDVKTDFRSCHFSVQNPLRLLIII